MIYMKMEVIKQMGQIARNIESKNNRLRECKAEIIDYQNEVAKITDDLKGMNLELDVLIKRCNEFTKEEA